MTNAFNTQNDIEQIKNTLTGFTRMSSIANDPRKITDELRQQVQQYIDSKSQKIIQELNSVRGQLDLKLEQLDIRISKIGTMDLYGQKAQTQRVQDNEAKIVSIEQVEAEQMSQLQGFKKEIEDILLLKDAVKQLSDMVMNSDKQQEQFKNIIQQFTGLQQENQSLQRRIKLLEERLEQVK